MTAEVEEKIALQNETATPVSNASSPDVAVPCLEVLSKSCWTPERLREAIQMLPAAELYPELMEPAAKALEGWHRRFPAKVWSRLVKIADSGTGRTQRIPKVLKEFNEAAPVLARLLTWVSESKASGQKPLDIVDLCSGFGFLSMFASELLPKDSVECIYLVDKSWANRGVQELSASSEHISNDHIYDHGEWRIPLLTLKLDLCKGADVRGLAKHVIRDVRPTILCGIHLCGTLSLRASQLFNDSVASGCGVIGLILAPCCLPKAQHRKCRFLYDVGGHRFAATDLFDRGPGNIESADGSKVKEGAYALYTRHVFKSLDTTDKTMEVIHIHRDSDRGGGTSGQNLFLVAKASFQHKGADVDVAGFGKPVVVEMDGKPRLPVMRSEQNPDVSKRMEQAVADDTSLPSDGYRG
eukprot:TRINITY_DN92757_c0_g1_i1.p1 TRINITY_DN92757_c0_g1~~TRINITY_DN92757_c0_g1_i1.p1  ORF type:complete len:411 (-),score=62.02 TRINITY_DN92757_c0_g1_i1:10-1242(-)